MDKRLLQTFRKKLEAQRDETLESLRHVQKDGRTLGQDGPSDTAELSVTSFSREFLFQQSTQRKHLLRNIEAALDRIHEDTFGECANCRNEISSRRLEDMPFTAYCRDCQETLERRQIPERRRA
jgi:RNA polymerase-binding protein DksA